MRLLNIGCGRTCHQDWENIDLISTSPAVKQYDIRKRLPYPENYFDAVYSSHLLEHLSKIEGKNLINECYRVLKKNGVIRLAVPDLEVIVKEYLYNLKKAVANNKQAADNYEWIMLELYDQVTRTYSGGEMRKYLSNNNISNKSYILQRIGLEAQKYFNNKDRGMEKNTNIILKLRIFSIIDRLIYIVKNFKYIILKLILRIIGGKEMIKVYEEVIVRNSGQIHKYMYDRYSLAKLLKEASFSNIKVCKAKESRIKNFSHYQLDIIDGHVRKPDSLFIEAMKKE